MFTNAKIVTGRGDATKSISSHKLFVSVLPCRYCDVGKKICSECEEYSKVYKKIQSVADWLRR